jgi:uncharacterized cupredoxin-like copper-binding protein
MSSTTPAALALAAAALGLSACGDGDDESAATAPPPTTAQPTTPGGTLIAPRGGTLTLTADPNGALEFDIKTATAHVGRLTIAMKNPFDIQHGIGVRGPRLNLDAKHIRVTGRIVGRGGSSTVTFPARKGIYEFFCPVPGHEEGGMKGTLYVS